MNLWEYTAEELIGGAPEIEMPWESDKIEEFRDLKDSN